LAALSASVAIVAAGQQQPVTTAVAQLGDPVSAGTATIRKATFSLPLDGVTPGIYKVQVKVAAGGVGIADLGRELEVVAGTRPLPPPPPDEPRARLRPDYILNGDFVRPARAALRGSTDSAAIRATQGFDMFARAEYAQASIALAEALRLNQSMAAVAFVLGWAYDETGQSLQAIGAWRAAAAIEPGMVPAHLALADGYLRLSDRTLAEQAIRAGLAAVPASPELQAKLAQILEKSR
jgi:hypothetical protein